MLFCEPIGILQARCSMQASLWLNKSGVMYHTSHLWNRYFPTSKLSQGHLLAQNNNFTVNINSKVEWKFFTHILLNGFVVGKLEEVNFWLLFPQNNFNYLLTFLFLLH